MPRRYTVPVSAQSISAAQDLLELTPADDKPIKLISVQGGVSNSETNEQFSITVQRRSGAFTSGSGGGTPSISKTGTIDAAVGFSAERNNTTRATGGTQEVLFADGFPSQGGFNITPLPNGEWIASQGEALIVGLENAPGSATDFSYTATVEELP